jgi:hypothetical protein
MSAGRKAGPVGPGAILRARGQQIAQPHFVITILFVARRTIV